jgi:hypothetical protein
MAGCRPPRYTAVPTASASQRLGLYLLSVLPPKYAVLGPLEELSTARKCHPKRPSLGSFWGLT